MLIDDIALTLIPGIGPKTAAYLLTHYASAEALFAAEAPEIISRTNLNERLAKSIARKETHRRAEQEMRYCERNGIRVIASTDPLYPKLLPECGDHPHVLYYIGDPEALTGRMLSVVGTRRMTSYGQKVCSGLIADLAAMHPDLVIVSGLAFGVDAAAHRSALAAGLRTVAVTADSLPDIYPSAHVSLAAEMARSGGGVLTEYHSGNKDKGVNFVPRNRIIAGMSCGTLIVESGAKGGSLITAGMADGYNRSVMAVPGRIQESASEGTNRLISTQRAVMVCSAHDIARELGWDSAAEPAPKRDYEASTLSEGAKRLIGFIREGEQIMIDDLARAVGMTTSELAPLLLELEFDGAIRMLPGKSYERL